MDGHEHPARCIREELWVWALSNLPTLRELAYRARGADQATSVVNSFLVRLFSLPTTALGRIRNRTGYAAVVIRNVIMGRFRRRSAGPGQMPEAVDPPDHRTGPGGPIEDERRLTFRLAWDELTADERYLIEAHELGGVSSEGIGAVLGISGAAVRKRKEHVVDKLRVGVRLLGAAREKRWEPGTLHYRLISLRHFRGLSVEAAAEALGWSRRQVETWLDRTREQLPADLRGLL